MAEFDELQDNINNLISQLKKNEDNQPDLSSLNNFVETSKGFDQYLKDIRSNTTDINKTLNTLLKEVNTIETSDETAPIEVLPPPINYGIEQQAFVDYNEELKRLVDKIENLSTKLTDVNTFLNLNIDVESIDKIKERLNSEDFKIEIDAEELGLELESLTSKLSEIKTITSDLSLSSLNTSFTEIKDNLTAIQELDFSNVNLNSLSTESLDEVISKINNIKEITVDLHVNNNLNEIELTLNKIKEIDFSPLENNLPTDKISELSKSIENIKLELPTEDIKNFIETLNKIEINIPTDSLDILTQKISDINVEELSVNLNIENALSKINEVESSVTKLKEDVSNINITANLKSNFNIDGLKEDIKKGVSELEVTIKPNIELSPLNIVSTEAVLTQPVQVEQKEDDNESIKEYLIENQKALVALKSTLETLAVVKEKEVNTTQIKETKTEVIGKVESSKEHELKMEDVLKALLVSMNEMVATQHRTITELKKANYLKNNDDTY